VGIAVSRLFTLRELPAAAAASALPPGVERAAPRLVSGPPGRHAAPRGRGDSAGPP
jgi:hypothetical protein